MSSKATDSIATWPSVTHCSLCAFALSFFAAALSSPRQPSSPWRPSPRPGGPLLAPAALASSVSSPSSSPSSLTSSPSSLSTPLISPRPRLLNFSHSSPLRFIPPLPPPSTTASSSPSTFALPHLRHSTHLTPPVASSFHARPTAHDPSPNLCRTMGWRKREEGGGASGGAGE
ncbi:hypothetical protein K523DRAFT_359050 [Schizophyllum commune Tattone D]|nr:hypothetical protein K523DRAFT_359050 [Schizophyllum commune Tattone D]